MNRIFVAALLAMALLMPYPGSGLFAQDTTQQKPQDPAKPPETQTTKPEDQAAPDQKPEDGKEKPADAKPKDDPCKNQKSKDS